VPVFYVVDAFFLGYAKVVIMLNSELHLNSQIEGMFVLFQTLRGAEDP
jgi:hypothetical protein